MPYNIINYKSVLIKGCFYYNVLKQMPVLVVISGDVSQDSQFGTTVQERKINIT